VCQIEDISKVAGVEWNATLSPGKFVQKDELTVSGVSRVPGLISKKGPEILPQEERTSNLAIHRITGDRWCLRGHLDSRQKWQIRFVI
jgi:hypothetical protein